MGSQFWRSSQNIILFINQNNMFFYFFHNANKKLMSKYINKICQRRIEIRAVLSAKEINSRFSPYTFIKNAPILPKIKNAESPIIGEKIIGKRTGRLVTCLTVVNGFRVRPKRVFVQIYALKIIKVLFFIIIIYRIFLEQIHHIFFPRLREILVSK